MVVFDAPKRAVPVGTAPVLQLVPVLKLFVPGLLSHVAFCACAGLALPTMKAPTRTTQANSARRYRRLAVFGSCARGSAGARLRRSRTSTCSGVARGIRHCESPYSRIDDQRSTSIRKDEIADPKTHFSECGPSSNRSSQSEEILLQSLQITEGSQLPARGLRDRHDPTTRPAARRRGNDGQTIKTARNVRL